MRFFEIDWHVLPPYEQKSSIGGGQKAAKTGHG